MPEKKKQHYVPKLVLKQFSIDTEKKMINIFNAERKFYKQNCPLKNQAQEDYFYGQDGVIENGLSKIEQLVAPIITNIISNKEVPQKDSEEYINLFFFSVLLSYRTKSAAEKINELIDKMFQELTKYDTQLNKVQENNIHIKHQNAAAYLLSIIFSKDSIKHAYDLEPILLINTSKSKFIISDNPCVKYNQFLEQRKHPGGHLGIIAKGLQIFFPISPNEMIVYYDKWAYKFGNKKDKKIYVSNEQDIHQLNLLQMINCYEIVFSNNAITEFYLDSLFKKAQHIREKDDIITNKIGDSQDVHGQNHITYTQYGDNKQINLQLTFVKQPEQAKKHILSDFVVQFRNEELRYSR
jgi:hypothetical protein